MPKYTFKKITRTTNILLASAMGIVFLSAPCLTHATSEPKNIQTPVTNTLLSQRADSSGDTSTTQSDFQEKNSILSLKTGRNLLKLGDLVSNLFILTEAPCLDHLRQQTIFAGLLGTSVALIESIAKNYETPGKYNNNIRRNALVICKLVGALGHMCLSTEKYRPLLFFTVPNLIFLAHSLYGDYKSYKTNKKDNSNAQNAHPTDEIACAIKNTETAS